MHRALAVVVGLLTLVGIGASIGHFLVEPYNAGFLEFPTITASHVILGAVYLTLAPIQFIGRVRARWIGYHRWAGRLLVAIGSVVGATALFIAFVIPFSGWWERVVIGFFGGLFLVALGKAFLHVRARRVALHREWMIRAFAIGLAIATMRIIFVPALLAALDHSHHSAPVAGEPAYEQIAMLSIVSFSLAFVLHSGVAEWWIRRTRRRDAPRAAAAGAT
jgi:hypothetical protein